MSSNQRLSTSTATTDSGTVPDGELYLDARNNTYDLSITTESYLKKRKRKVIAKFNIPKEAYRRGLTKFSAPRDVPRLSFPNPTITHYQSSPYASVPSLLFPEGEILPEPDIDTDSALIFEYPTTLELASVSASLPQIELVSPTEPSSHPSPLPQWILRPIVPRPEGHHNQPGISRLQTGGTGTTRSTQFEEVDFEALLAFDRSENARTYRFRTTARTAKDLEGLDIAAFHQTTMVTQDQLVNAASLFVISETGEDINFGSLWKYQRTIVIFIRHFW